MDAITFFLNLECKFMCLIDLVQGDLTIGTMVHA